MSGQTSIQSKLPDLRINLPPNPQSTPSMKKEEVIESWEDDDPSSPTEDDRNTHSPTEGMGGLSLKLSDSADPALRPPPPTPIVPGNGGQIDWSSAQVLGGGRPSTRPYTPSGASTPQTDSDRERRRPEKTTTTASRMIAAGLGMKAPKKTEEQRQYDRAVREQEMKRRNKEKEDREREREADEKAKAAVWED
ncbi:uncharacterized protein Z520_08896 [Fonsecaea multimorphosa CBS 102226]|uniref:Uncharacterized protein n=1 Tax=Fonsecaea multimorphosa CBS 102226 TaxID=1442371 RepID=A0A0D2JY02_9EURO|nr:uncharacterized protein Z520_08896 [Fonsecaea multimorphosa CBS 102226]KIX95379.1 hypothetical protein Z520_08896 [Fonsecaea multimorphosa CBS 102226]OAL21047.1 hypothetical protein AYO22_08331 [Fonsecaea multimorphosa]